MSPLPPSRWAMRHLARLLRPSQRLSVSAWADLHRTLSAKSSSEPGRWRTDRTPYLREIMDALSTDSPVQRVVVQKSAQLGATEAAVNWIGYIMAHIRHSKPTLVVVPTDRLLIRWVHQRLRPMIEGSAALREMHTASKSRDGSNRLDLIDYPGGLLYLTTAGSASNLKSDSICYVICDEADEYEWDVGGRGDPLGLIESRQSNFPRRKLLIFSTPSVKGSSRIEGEYLASDQRRYQMPCPQCGEYQELAWPHLGWTEDLGRVWYTCAHNGCVIDERDKPAMLAAGRWVPSHPGRSVRGYALNALYAPLGLGYSWHELAAQWLRAADSDELQQQFVNERLGEAWEDRRTAVRADDLAARAEPYPLRQIPEGGLLLTAGIDTQDNRLEAQIIAWGESGAWWVVDYLVLPGDTGRPAVWLALSDYLRTPVESAAGGFLHIEMAAVDMGGHHTEAVKTFARGRRGVVAVMGSRYRLKQPIGRQRLVDYTVGGRTIRRGMRYHEVGTEIAKDRLFHDLRTDADLPPQDRFGHFSSGLEPEYYEGLMSEHWNPKRQRYEAKRGKTRRNEPLDTWVYAFAAAHHPTIRLDRMRKIDWRQRRGRLESMTEQSMDQPNQGQTQGTAKAPPKKAPARAPRQRIIR